MNPTVFLIFAATGTAGAVLRYHLDPIVHARITALHEDPSDGAIIRPPWLARLTLRFSPPAGTLLAGVAVCFVLGILAGAFMQLPQSLMGTAAMGFMGGFAVFSTATLAAERIVGTNRGARPILYSTVTVFLSLLASSLGVGIASLVL